MWSRNATWAAFFRFVIRHPSKVEGAPLAQLLVAEMTLRPFRVSLIKGRYCTIFSETNLLHRNFHYLGQELPKTSCPAFRFHVTHLPVSASRVVWSGSSLCQFSMGSFIFLKYVQDMAAARRHLSPTRSGIKGELSAAHWSIHARVITDTSPGYFASESLATIGLTLETPRIVSYGAGGSRITVLQKLKCS